MAETPAPTPSSVSDTSEYWCYHCDKRVSIETVPNSTDNEIICRECKTGFVVETIPAAATSPPLATSPDHHLVDDPTFGSQLFQIVRLIAQATREEDAPPALPPEPRSDDDYLRIELDGWNNDEDDDDDANDSDNNTEDNFGEDNIENNNVEGNENEGGRNLEEERQSYERNNRDDEDEDEVEDYELEEDLRRRRRDVIRLQIRDLATRARTGRNRILDWAEILMGLEDNSIEFRLEVPESDRYVGNPGDYVDAAEYEALLQNLAGSDAGRRGAPPAAKSAVAELPKVLITKEDDTLLCAICKDTVNVGETATKLPCAHGYHGECILQWLEARNSCPVCRFELPTDDLEYEEGKKKTAVRAGGGASGGASGSSGGISSSG